MEAKAGLGDFCMLRELLLSAAGGLCRGRKCVYVACRYAAHMCVRLCMYRVRELSFDSACGSSRMKTAAAADAAVGVYVCEC